jgi:hypothetical protein
MKGTDVSEIKLSTDINMCQFGFEIGDAYLVYAYGDEKRGLITDSFCWRTDALETALDDVHFLRALVKNRPEPRLYGSVQSMEKDALTNSFRYPYLEGIKIIAARGKKRYVALTDKNGLYSFDNLPNGTYKVFPELPPGSEVLPFPTDEIVLTSGEELDSADYRALTGRNAYAEFQIIRKIR